MLTAIWTTLELRCSTNRRTPLSLFAPALDLPVWGALAQILLVFGPAEVRLGRWHTLAVAYPATPAGTVPRTGVAWAPPTRT